MAKRPDPKDVRIRTLDINVYEAAKARLARTYKTFDYVVVSFSGGKDSLVCLGLCREVLDELGRGSEPVRFFFRDEEVIQQEVIDNVLHYMEHPGFQGVYYAVPMKNQRFILGEHRPYTQWDPEREGNWVRQPPACAVRQLHPRGLPLRQSEMNPLTLQHMGLRGKVGIVVGIRADESLTRRRAVTSKTVDNYLSDDPTGFPGISLVRPIYDWGTADVFKFIYDSKLRYAAIYDKQAWANEQPRVSTPLHNESYQSLMRLRSTYPDFFQQIISIWPDVITQERYWKDWDEYGAIDKYPKSWTGVVQMIHDTISDPRAKKQALKTVEGAMRAKQNNIRLFRYRGEENGGCYAYPLYNIFKAVISGRYTDGIQPKPYPSAKEIEFEIQAKQEAKATGAFV